jgi:hypothetical protein
MKTEIYINVYVHVSITSYICVYVNGHIQTKRIKKSSVITAPEEAFAFREPESHVIDILINATEQIAEAKHWCVV